MSMQKVLPGSQTIAAHVADQCKQLYSALPTALQAVLGLAQRLIDAALTKRKVVSYWLLNLVRVHERHPQAFCKSVRSSVVPISQTPLHEF